VYFVVVLECLLVYFVVVLVCLYNVMEAHTMSMRSEVLHESQCAEMGIGLIERGLFDVFCGCFSVFVGVFCGCFSVFVQCYGGAHDVYAQRGAALCLVCFVVLI